MQTVRVQFQISAFGGCNACPSDKITTNQFHCLRHKIRMPGVSGGGDLGVGVPLTLTKACQLCWGDLGSSDQGDGATLGWVNSDSLGCGGGGHEWCSLVYLFIIRGKGGGCLPPVTNCCNQALSPRRAEPGR